MSTAFSSLPATAAERFDLPVEDGVTIAFWQKGFCTDEDTK